MASYTELLAQILGGRTPQAAFGTTSPAEDAERPPNEAAGFGAAMGRALATLPQRAIQNSQYSLDSGTYDPAVPVEAAMTLTGTGAPFAEKGAAGIFGGKLAATADKSALGRAEEMAAKGSDRTNIWNDTGWFKGADNKWRFEIDDSKAAITPHVASEFERRSIGDQVPVQNADRFMNHPEAHNAYPDLWRVNTRLEKGGGYPYTPSANYTVRESGAEGIGLNADTLGRAKSLNMHELQHAIQNREGFASGADLHAVGRDAYNRSAGEVEAYNVQRRLDMTPAERKATPPWATEDVPFEQQIVSLFSK